MRKPTLIVVGADKGGVGKTTTSRAMLDYFGSLRVPVRAFDTEHPNGALKRFYPEATSIVDMNAIKDQMNIFDALSENYVTMIDVRAGLLSRSLAALKNIGLFDAIVRGQVSFALFHVVGPSVSSIDEIPQITPYLESSEYFLVRNYINETEFVNWNGQAQHVAANGIHTNEITIPKLNELAYEQVEKASIPFTTFIANRDTEGNSAKYSFVLRGYVRHWLKAVWTEFDRSGLQDFVNPVDRRVVQTNRSDLDRRERERTAAAVL